MPKNTPTNYREKLEIEKEKKQRAKFKKLKALKKLRKDDDSFQSVSSHKPIDNVGTPNKVCFQNENNGLLILDSGEIRSTF